MDNTIADHLFNQLKSQANPKTKAWWENYVKGSAPFMGVKMPIIREELHKWHQAMVVGYMDDHEQLDLALSLFHRETTEEKLAGIIFLQEICIPSGAINCPGDIYRLAELFRQGYIYDWNVCDWFSVKVLSDLIARHGSLCAREISDWHTAENLWQARASLVAFVKHADHDDYYPLIHTAIVKLIHREERFAKTAVGWMLREISRADQEFVHTELEANLRYFSIESLKNATKYFSKDDQKSYLQQLKSI